MAVGFRPGRTPNIIPRGSNGARLSSIELKQRERQKQKMLQRLMADNVEKFPFVMIGDNELYCQSLISNPNISPHTFRAILRTGNSHALEGSCGFIRDFPCYDTALSDIMNLPMDWRMKEALLRCPRAYIADGYYDKNLLNLAIQYIRTDEFRLLATVKLFELVLARRGVELGSQILKEACDNYSTLEDIAGYFGRQIGAVTGASNRAVSEVESRQQKVLAAVASRAENDDELLQHLFTEKE